MCNCVDWDKISKERGWDLKPSNKDDKKAIDINEYMLGRLDRLEKEFEEKYSSGIIPRLRLKKIKNDINNMRLTLKELELATKVLEDDEY